MIEDAAAALMPLGFSLAIGLLIGLERGWTSRSEPRGHRVAGFRTFGILGLAGGVTGLVHIAFGAIIFIAAAIIIIAGYFRETAGGSTVSATNMLVALLTLLLGLLATTGHPVAALAAAATTTLLLSMRRSLHKLLRGMSEAEMRAVARFAIVAFVILPLLPDRAMGPYDAWNPHKLWLVVVLVSGLSFAGYVAARRLGPKRGLLATAVFGAIVSSTAVTAAYARRLDDNPAERGALISGIALASLVMFVRVQVLAAVLAPHVSLRLAILMMPALAVAAILAWWALRSTDGANVTDGQVKIGNPLELSTALGLAAFVAVLAVASRWAIGQFGGMGMAVLLGLTGLADVDAAVITMAGLPRETFTPHIAALVLSLPILLNTLLKAGIAVVLSPNRIGLRAAFPLVASVIASCLAALALWP